VASHTHYLLQMGEHFFTTFVRTKTLFKQRLKDLKRYDTLRVYAYELDKLGVNNGPLLWQFKESGNVANKFRSFRVYLLRAKHQRFALGPDRSMTFYCLIKKGIALCMLKMEKSLLFG